MAISIHPSGPPAGEQPKNAKSGQLGRLSTKRAQSANYLAELASIAARASRQPPLEFAGDGLQLVLFDFAVGQQIDVRDLPFRIEWFAEVPLAFQVQPKRQTAIPVVVAVVAEHLGDAIDELAARFVAFALGGYVERPPVVLRRQMLGARLGLRATALEGLPVAGERTVRPLAPGVLLAPVPYVVNRFNCLTEFRGFA